MVAINNVAAAAATMGVSALAGYVPSLDVPQCPQKCTAEYTTSVPDKGPFPLTKVSLCYDDSAIKLDFIATNEQSFYYNASLTTNDPIYNYNVMEAFIYRGTEDPSTYMEFEVAPNNVTFNAFIYNPSKVRADGAPFDTLFIQTPQDDGLTATTVLDKENEKWVSHVNVPLAFFNVDTGKAKGTCWRMNFFRTITNETAFPTQWYGAWSVPTDGPANFHQTPFFGNINFV